MYTNAFFESCIIQIKRDKIPPPPPTFLMRTSVSMFQTCMHMYEIWIKSLMLFTLGKNTKRKEQRKSEKDLLQQNKNKTKNKKNKKTNKKKTTKVLFVHLLMLPQTTSSSKALSPNLPLHTNSLASMYTHTHVLSNTQVYASIRHTYIHIHTVTHTHTCFSCKLSSNVQCTMQDAPR